MQGKPKVFSLGQFDERAYDHARFVEAEARAATGDVDGVAQSVTVAVWMNGYLQFAGSDVLLNGRRIDRLAAKNQAFDILLRMNPEGAINKEGDK